MSDVLEKSAVIQPVTQEKDTPPEALWNPEEVVRWYYDFFTLFIEAEFANFDQENQLTLNEQQTRAIVSLKEINSLVDEYFGLKGSKNEELTKKIKELIQNNHYLPKNVELSNENFTFGPDQELYISSYFHDIRNIIAIMYGNISMLDEEKDEVWKQKTLSAIQRALSSLITVHGSFDLREGKTILHREKVSAVLNYLSSLKRGDHSYEKLNISVTVDTELINSELRKYESFFNVPAWLRLYINAAQNATKMWEVMKAKGYTLEKLNVMIKAKVIEEKGEKFLILSIDDQGLGFPNSRGIWSKLRNVFRSSKVMSEHTGVEYLPYIPKKGKTAWGGKVEGTGTGLAAMIEVFKEARIEFAMGTRITSQGYQGAHTELKIPLLKKEE